MWKTVLFDLDGTLTDSAPGITNSVAYMLAHYGIREEAKNLLHFVGPPLTESLRELYGFDNEKGMEAVGFFREYFNEKGWLENAPYPGVEDLLRSLKAAGLTLLVATSKPEFQAVRVLNHFSLAKYFDHICGAPPDSEEGARKSVVIRAALSRLGDPSPAVMVGDRRHDVAGAHEAGLPCIGVLYGYGDRGELQGAGAEFIAEDVADLRQILLAAEGCVSPARSHAY